MSDVISEVVLGSFWLMLPGLGLVNDRGTKFSRGRNPGRGLNFAPTGAGAVKHISWFSYLKKNKSTVDGTYIVMVDVILKLCSFSFSQCKAKFFSET